MRRGEVARLELDDIDWRAGELVVCGSRCSPPISGIPRDTYWYLSAAPELLRIASQRLQDAQEAGSCALAPTPQAFFTQRLIRERNASPHTIAAYGDTLRLLLRFAASNWPGASTLDIADSGRDHHRGVPRSS